MGVCGAMKESFRKIIYDESVHLLPAKELLVGEYMLKLQQQKLQGNIKKSGKKYYECNGGLI